MEVIVVDNGSSDATAQVARHYGARVVPEARRGITWAVLAGFNAARGDIILRTDADAILPEDFVAEYLRAWASLGCTAASGEVTGARRWRLLRRRNREVVAMTGAARFLLKAPWSGILSWAYLGAYRLTTASALGHAPLFGTNCSLRRSWWEVVRDSVDFSNTVVHEDLHLSFAVRPGETIMVNDSIEVEMDPRALYGARQLGWRLYRGFYTIFLNWTRQSPQARWWARIRVRG